jgi:hypothetical protein
MDDPIAVLQCKKCGGEFTEGGFHASLAPFPGRSGTAKTGGSFGWCKACVRARNRAFYAKNPEAYREKARLWYKRNAEKARKKTRDNGIKNKKIVVDQYGGFCACCRETEIVWLTVDHINGDGKTHRQAQGSGSALHRWLIRHGFPPGFQILCANCHLAKSSGVNCPHKV